MKKIVTFMILSFFTVSLFTVDVEARRMGGGKSFGKQRQSLQQYRQNQQQTPASGQASASSKSGNKWGGALAGLAAGGLLAALFMGGAFEGINMMDVIMLILIAGAVIFVMRMMRRPHATTTNHRMQYSGVNAATHDELLTRSGMSAILDENARHQDNIPSDFKVEPFLRHAKISFIRLQAANDTGDLNDIREYTTPETFAEISMQIQERGDVVQKSEVMFVDANLLNVETSDAVAIASVRFTGQMRELPDGEPEVFDEIWHVEKNLNDPDSVWLLAGIQQIADTDIVDDT